LRRAAFACHAKAASCRAHLVFMAWASLVHCEFGPGEPVPLRKSRGWVAAAGVDQFARARKLFCRVNAALWAVCARLQWLVRPLNKLNRGVFLEQKAHEAQQAARANDTRIQFAIVRCLSGSVQPRAKLPIIQLGGSLTSNDGGGWSIFAKCLTATSNRCRSCSASAPVSRSWRQSRPSMSSHPAPKTLSHGLAAIRAWAGMVCQLSCFALVVRL
jgi:hypothetical protein